MLDWIEELDAEVADDAAADAYYHGLAREAAADRVYAVCAEIGISPWTPDLERAAVDALVETGDYNFAEEQDEDGGVELTVDFPSFDEVIATFLRSVRASAVRASGTLPWVPIRHVRPRAREMRRTRRTRRVASRGSPSDSDLPDDIARKAAA